MLTMIGGVVGGKRPAPDWQDGSAVIDG